MRSRSRHLVWFLAIGSLVWLGCGSGDDDIVPHETLDAAADAEGEANADAGRPVSDSGIDRGSFSDGTAQDAPSADTSSTDASSDANGSDTGIEGATPDAGTQDVSTGDGSNPDVSLGDAGSKDATIDDVAAEPPEDHVTGPVDAGPDLQTVDTGTDTGALTDATPSDTGSLTDSGSPGDGGTPTDAGHADDAQGGPDGSSGTADAGPPDVVVDAPEEFAFDASFDGATSDAAGQDAPSLDALSDGDGGPEMVHWKIEASPPECSANPAVVSCGDNGTAYEFYASTGCPTDISEADLWFAGGVPDPGPHQVHAAASQSDLYTVTGTDVALFLTRTSPREVWWGRDGTVYVDADGDKRMIRFSDVAAFEDSDHSRVTTIGGFLTCVTAGKPKR